MATNHRVRIMTAAEQHPFWMQPGAVRLCGFGGKGNRCKKPAAFKCQYDYVAMTARGGGGLATSNTKCLCGEHAARFCKTHKLTLPYLPKPAVPPPRDVRLSARDQFEAMQDQRK
jgi:hypothetical protein